MSWAAAALLALGAGARGIVPVAGDGAGLPIALPSGRTAAPLDVITTAAGVRGPTYRFRFVAPWIADGVDFDLVSADMAYLCAEYAIPRIADIGPQPARIVVSLSERPVDFGQSAPDTVQFFESYRPQGDSCVWELF